MGSEKMSSASAAADIVAGILSRWIKPEQIVRMNLLIFTYFSSVHRLLRKPGPGLGGPYLLPSIHELVYICEHFNLHDKATYWRAVLEMDEYQRRRLIEVVMSHTLSFKGKRAAVLGFAYKAFNSDSRGSPSVDIVRSLLQEGASVYIYTTLMLLPRTS